MRIKDRLNVSAFLLIIAVGVVILIGKGAVKTVKEKL